MHLLRVQGFYFVQMQCSPYKRLQRVLFRSCSYTAHTAKRHTWLYRRFSCDFPYSTARDTRPKQAAIIPPATRWSTSQRRSTSSAYQIPAPRRTLYRTAQPPYYNNVYKGAAVCLCYRSMPDGATHRRPCQPGGVSMLPTPGISMVPGWPGISLALCFLPGTGGAEPLTAAAVSLFGLSPDS